MNKIIQIEVLPAGGLLVSSNAEGRGPLKPEAAIFDIETLFEKLREDLRPAVERWLEAMEKNQA